MNIVALAGGVGGAKLADGLARVLPDDQLTVVVNVGDDFEHYGLKICPDLDTVCYTLARKANPLTGWGRARESWRAMDTIKSLDGLDWFQLGDRDIGLHLERTRRIQMGDTLSEFTDLLRKKWNIRQRILPATNDRLQTIVHTSILGALPFQEYFVRQKCQPLVTGFTFGEVEKATPTPGLLEAIDDADFVVICPSNPFVSIDPILAVPGIRSSLQTKRVIGVTPIVGGRAIKGPAAKMFMELGFPASPISVAEHYRDLLSVFLIDYVDGSASPELIAMGITPVVNQTIMNGIRGRIRLAREIVRYCEQHKRLAV